MKSWKRKVVWLSLPEPRLDWGNIQKSLQPLERRRRKGACSCSDGKNPKEKVNELLRTTRIIT